VDETIRATDALTGVASLFPRRRFLTILEASPWSWLTRIHVDASYGKDVDFTRARPGHGGQVNFSSTVRPTDHMQIDLLANRRWLDVEDGNDEPRLFTAKVERVRATYTFNSKSFLRLIGQRDARTQNPALYGFTPPVPAKQVALDYSALFAYKLNWQSVLFFGYQEQSAWSESTTDVEIAGRSLFLKISYAFQR
jgi:hypothetical protein